jgi:hypothetical protein
MPESPKMYVLCARQYAYNDEIYYCESDDSGSCEIIFTKHKTAIKEASKRSFDYVVSDYDGNLDNFYYEPSEFFKSMTIYEQHKNEGLIGPGPHEKIYVEEDPESPLDSINSNMPIERWDEIYDNMISPFYFVQETVVDTSELLE